MFANFHWLPSRYLLVQSQQWKHQKNQCNIYEFTDVVLSTLLMTLNKFHALFWCLHCWIWRSSCRLGSIFFTRWNLLVQSPQLKHQDKMWNLSKVNDKDHCEKCVNTEFHLVRIFPNSDWIRENKDQKKTLYLDTFHVVNTRTTSFEVIQISLFLLTCFTHYSSVSIIEFE